MNPSALPNISVGPGSQTKLNFFANAEPEVEWRNLDRHARGNFTWHGQLVDDPASAATLTVVGDAKVLHLLSPTYGHFELRSQSDGGSEIRQFDAEKLKGDGQDFVLQESGSGTNGLPLAESSATPTPKGAGVTGVTIDVLMVYTTKAMDAAGGRSAMVALCQSAVNGENGNFSRSDISHRMRLVQTLEIGHTSSGNLATELGYVAGNSTVAAQRNTAGADVVAILSETDTTGTYGIAQQLGSTSGDSGVAFSAIYYDVVGGVWPHEVGHNLGCMHNSPGVYSYSSGHYWANDNGNTYGSMMSYIGIRVPYFSNPDVSHWTGVTGTATRDNARSIDNIGDNVAAYRTAKTLIEPSCSIGASTTSPVEGTNFTLTVIAVNGGPSTATACQLTVTLPSQLTLVSNDGGSTFNTSTKVWDVPDLADNATAKLVLTVRPNSGAAGVAVTPKVTVSSIGSSFVDFDLYNNDDSVTVIPLSVPTTGNNRAWSGTADHSWATAASWSGASVPNSTGENAVFTTIASDATGSVTINGTAYTLARVSVASAGYTFGQLNFANNPSGTSGWDLYTGTVGSIGLMTMKGDNGANPVIVVGSGCPAAYLDSGSGHNLRWALGKNGANEIQVNGSSVLQIVGYITNGVGVTAGLTKTGTGTLVLALYNMELYSGDTTISAGTLQLAAGNPHQIPYGAGYGNLVMNPSSGTATLNLNGNSQNLNGLSSSGSGASVVEAASGTPTLTVGNNNASSTFSGIIRNTAGTLALTKTGSGTLTLSGANTYIGVSALSDGTLNLGSTETPGTSGPLGKSPAANPGSIVLNGGTLRYSAINRNDYSGRFSTAAGQQYRVDNNGQDVTWASALTSAGGTLTKTGAGMLTLSGTNTYTGVSTISAGTVNLGSAETVGASGPLGQSASANPGSIILNGGTLQYSSANHNDYSGRFSAIAGQAFNIDVNGQAVSFGTALTSSGGTLRLTDTDSGGTLTLSATNTYTGPTTISAGTLRVNGALAGGAVTIATGAALEGTGTIVGPVTVESGGNLAPGASIGTLTISNNLTLAGNLFIEANKSASPSNDLIVVTGTLTNAGEGTVTLINLGPTALVAGDRFRLFNQPLLNGQAMTIVPLPGTGLSWSNNLAVDGSVSVVATANPPVPATNLTIVAAGPASFRVSGQGGANQTYGIYAQTNVAAWMTNWWLIGTTNADAGGLIQFLDTRATNARRFYHFGQ